MATILVTGANGQVGTEFRELGSSFPHHQFFFAGRAELDLQNEESIETIFSSLAPHYCINCAAYTAVDKAETEQDLAFSINTFGVKKLAEACNRHNTKLVHISTDYVFDGSASQPYKEEDETNPISVYGRSKLAGEQAAQQACGHTIIIRTSWVYSAYGNNFVKTMLRLMQSKPELNVVADQQGSPTYAADLARAIMMIIESKKWEPGIFHYSNEGVISWFQFAEAIKEMASLDCIIHPIPTEQYPTPARRPRYSVLNKEKITRTYHINLVPWRESLRNCISKLQSTSS